MAGVFQNQANFNNSLDNWVTDNVTNMSEMFINATIFNQPLNSWNVSSVTNMSAMFAIADKFNQPLDTWNVSSVTNFDDMFNQEKLIEDFVEYLIEEEVEADYYHNDNYDLITTWVENNYWGDLGKYFTYDNICDMSLIKYLSEMNEEFDGTLLDCLFNSIENKKHNINHSRETLYQLVIDTRLKMIWTECIDKLIEIKNND